jgi:hypothetical protein
MRDGLDPKKEKEKEKRKTNSTVYISETSTSDRRYKKNLSQFSLN